MLYDICYWWSFLFLKVIDEQNTLCIPKYGGQNLGCWCLHNWTAFTCCCPLTWLSIWLWREVVDLCFIHCHIFMQKLLFVVLKQLQTMLWIVNSFLFLINWANVAPTLNAAFSLTNVHVKWSIRCLLFMIGQNKFLVFFGTTAKFGQPKHSVSFVSVQPCLKLAYHLLTVVSDGAESE